MSEENGNILDLGSIDFTPAWAKKEAGVNIGKVRDQGEGFREKVSGSREKGAGFREKVSVSGRGGQVSGGRRSPLAGSRLTTVRGSRTARNRSTSR